MAIKVPNEFSIDQKVYLVTDPDQKTYIVTALIVLKNEVMYRVRGVDGQDEYYGFELCETKDVINP